MKKALVLNPVDTVAVCIEDITAGDMVTTEYEEIAALQDILMPHKIARKNISKGKEILKYSYTIGYASCDIKKGEWVHTHNISPTKPQNQSEVM